MPVATDTFRWSESYSVHIAVLDTQHRNLLATMNELNRALRAGEGKAVVDAVLQKLVDYSLQHFATEEALMTKHEFPGLATHCAHHQKFCKTIGEFLADHRAAKPGVPVSLMLFMHGWLKHHLITTDQQ